MSERSKILVVDDEAVPRRLVALTLRPYADVITVSNGYEAIEILERRRLDLLISDGFMPGMSGTQLIERAIRMYPEMPCLMVSGNIDDERVKWLNEVNVPYLAKPWRVDELVTIVKRLLAV